MPIPSNTFANIVTTHGLEINKKYPVTSVRRLVTSIGSKVLFTLRIDNGDPIEIYLPKVYGRVLDDDDITTINIRTKNYNLIYRGSGLFSPC